MRLDTKKMDVDALDELIGKCEDKMVSPFKKKKAIEVEEVPESADIEEEADESEGIDKDLSEMDLQDLLSMYKELKENE